MSPICPPCCGCHGYGRGAFYSQQLWASGGRTREPILMKFGVQQQIRTTMTVTAQILKFLKFKMADDRHVGKYSKCHNSPTNGPTGTQIGCSQRPLSSNDALYIQQLWASGDRTREPNLMKFGKLAQIRTTMTVTWSNIIFFNSKWRTAAMFENIRNVKTRLI